MQDMSVIWLRAALVLYSLGLLHVLLTVLHRSRERVFQVAMTAFYTGVVLHLVSIVEHTVIVRHFPVNDFFESASVCAVLIAILFLLVHWRYQYQSLAVFTFPLVFVLTLVGELGVPVATWSSHEMRDAWLLVHIVLVLTGYAALLLTAVASIMYLLRERQLKTKKASGPLNWLPPLGTLDALMARAMSVGFVFITLSVIAGSTWASIESGARWIADPRIVISLFTWVLYLVIVFVRVTAGWRGRKAALMMIALVCCSAITWAAHTGLRTLLSK
jgi:ABC-type uncharacterized transport system permease subunit